MKIVHSAQYYCQFPKMNFFRILAHCAEAVMSDNANPPTRPPVAMRNSFRGVVPVDVHKSLLLNFRVQGSVLALCNRGSYCNKKQS